MGAPKHANGPAAAVALVLVLTLVTLVSGCGDAGDGPATGSDAGGMTDGAAGDGSSPSDGGVDDDGGVDVDGGPEDGATGADAGTGCGTAGIVPMVAHDMTEGALGDGFLGWRRSVVDDTHALSGGRALRVSTNPGDALLPECSGSHFFAGRSDLPDTVPQGATLWYRAFFYLPGTFSLGHKYAGAGDRDAAEACGQHADGNRWIKWLVLAPDIGTARIYMMPSGARRAVRSSSPEIRLISEALHSAADTDMELPRDRWFALQIAVHVSDGDDGWIRGWIDDEPLGEVTGRTTAAGAALLEWGLGDYWNGVPWTDGEPGRSDFWMDEVVVTSDAEGYAPPTALDSDGRPYIPSCVRVADLR